jgi:hypothetical protein
MILSYSTEFSTNVILIYYERKKSFHIYSEYSKYVGWLSLQPDFPEPPLTYLDAFKYVGWLSSQLDFPEPLLTCLDACLGLKAWPKEATNHP